MADSASMPEHDGELGEGAPLIGPSSTDHPMFSDVIAAIRTVHDPEIPVNIYDLGLIYRVSISEENDVEVDMTLTAPGCPVAGEIPGWVADAIEPLAGVRKVDVEIVWDPPWDMSRLSDEARLELGML
ncbi:MAG: SUF system Fe-S cluster assembly protein [Pseudomonadota bacterium]